MEQLRQEYILSIMFLRAIDREDLLIRKYSDYRSALLKARKGKSARGTGGAEDKDGQLVTLLDEFEEIARGHINMLKDKMIKLNIQG